MSKALRKEGLKASANDTCLLNKDTVLVVLYVDDLGIRLAYRNQPGNLTSFLKLAKRRISARLARAHLVDFLGINFTRQLIEW